MTHPSSWAHPAPSHAAPRFVCRRWLATLSHDEELVAAAPPGIKRLLDTYQSIPQARTRNFAIVAHVDHGKSSMADRLLESTGNVLPFGRSRQQVQVMDGLEVRRWRLNPPPLGP